MTDLPVPTPYLCNTLLNYLDTHNIDTKWIRTIYSQKGISDKWCYDRIMEIASTNHLEIPSDLILYPLDPVSSYLKEYASHDSFAIAEAIQLTTN